MRNVFLAILVLGFWCGRGQASDLSDRGRPAPPYLIADLNTGPSEEAAAVFPGTFPGSLAGLGGLGPGVSYFSAGDPAHGTELWRSDGTPAGTYRLTDVCAGRCSADPQSVTLFNGLVVFTADDGFSGREPWLSDGTAGGERRLRDLCPGSCSSATISFQSVAGRLLFLAKIGPRMSLWRSDGTRAGTVRVKGLCTGDCDFFSNLASIGGLAFFSVREPADFWVTDGTAEGTRPLRDALGSDIPSLGLVPLVVPGDGFAWLWTAGGVWRTDGTAAGTRRLKAMSDLATDPAGDNVPSQQAFWHGLSFTVLGAGELIRSDGTPEGTFRIAQPAPGYDVSDLVALPDDLLFLVYNPLHQASPISLWHSRGTAETTGPVPDLDSGMLEGLSRAGDRALFGRHPAVGAVELWVTDGTAAGTRRLDLPPGHGDPASLFSAGDRVYFLRWNAYAADDLWITDGTDAGTQQVRDFRAVPASGGPLAQIAYRDGLLFSAQTSFRDAQLFVTDGSAGGTLAITGGDAWAFSLTRVGNRFFYPAASRSLDHREELRLVPQGLWQTDGTQVGTRRVARKVDDFASPAALSGALLFAAAIQPTFQGLVNDDVELWTSNGSAKGTALLKNIDPYEVESGFLHRFCGGESSSPVAGVALGNRLLLTADDGKHGRELWATDGTRQGTRLVLDINPRRSPFAIPPCEDAPDPGRQDSGLSSNPGSFVKYQGGALFSADDGTAGRELWKTDGTSHGTRRVADLLPGAKGSAPHDLVAFQGQVYFLAAAPGPGDALWRSDGTARATVPVRDLSLNGLPSWGRSLTVAGGHLFFTVYNESTGAELWASGGETSTTDLVADLNPGPASAAPQALTAFGDVLLFAATDGLTGHEPWRSDGTAAGTYLVGDLNPGPDSSSPGPFTGIGNVVITGADNGVRGREPWAIPIGNILPSPP